MVQQVIGQSVAAASAYRLLISRLQNRAVLMIHFQGALTGRLDTLAVWFFLKHPHPQLKIKYLYTELSISYIRTPPVSQPA